MIFDTLQYTKKAIDAGFSKQQAEFQATELKELSDFHTNEIVTKKDILSLEIKIESKIDKLKLELTIIIITSIGLGIGVLSFLLKSKGLL